MIWCKYYRSIEFVAFIFPGMLSYLSPSLATLVLLLYFLAHCLGKPSEYKSAKIKCLENCG
ncbi:hypothetical protein TetV_633 [Tetraselmis virus 1]|uniref:Uncharacterized protein n=1 Tax=Tetraselmis virus 1 TaxID=2060617 RepID=A0A2P0VP76_9VIRU|nr:hypothetical protein QJ968_gp421 [Tetraselmis virus 1]AUF82715.1 hypothetical protein TetV_633 [Tetraselmis virus 1]